MGTDGIKRDEERPTPDQGALSVDAMDRFLRLEQMLDGIFAVFDLPLGRGLKFRAVEKEHLVAPET